MAAATDYSIWTTTGLTEHKMRISVRIDRESETLAVVQALGLTQLAEDRQQVIAALAAEFNTINAILTSRLANGQE